MGTVDGGENSLCAGESAELLRWQDDSRESRDVAEKEHACARGDGVAEEIQHLRRVFHGAGKRDLLHHDAIALSLQIPWMLASWMLLVGHEHFVARLHVDAVGDVAVCLGRVAQKGDLIALAADEFRQRVAELVPGGVSPDRIILGILLVHFLGSVVSVEDGPQNRGGAGADGSVIEVDLVFRDDELPAHLGPKRVFVLVKQSAIGKRWNLLELRKKIAAQGERRGDSGGGGGKKSTAVEHEGRGLLAVRNVISRHPGGPIPKVGHSESRETEFCSDRSDSFHPRETYDQRDEEDAQPVVQKRGLNFGQSDNHVGPTGDKAGDQAGDDADPEFALRVDPGKKTAKGATQQASNEDTDPCDDDDRRGGPVVRGEDLHRGSAEGGWNEQRGGIEAADVHDRLQRGQVEQRCVGTKVNLTLIT